MNAVDIILGLPHKPPAVLLDQVVSIDEGKRLTARKNVTQSEPCFAGHFPGYPVMPSAMMVELMAQACALLAHRTEGFTPTGKIISVVGINNGKFHRLGKPGDQLLIEAELAMRRSNVWRFDVRVNVEEQLVAEAQLVLSIMDRDSTP